MYAVGGLISQLIEKYTDLPGVVGHLKDMQADIVDNVDVFLRSTEQQGLTPRAQISGHMQGMDSEGSPAMRRYAVNLIIDHTGEQGAPVVFEEKLSPTGFSGSSTSSESSVLYEPSTMSPLPKRTSPETSRP